MSHCQHWDWGYCPVVDGVERFVVQRGFGCGVAGIFSVAAALVAPQNTHLLFGVGRDYCGNFS